MAAILRSPQRLLTENNQFFRGAGPIVSSNPAERLPRRFLVDPYDFSD